MEIRISTNSDYINITRLGKTKLAELAFWIMVFDNEIEDAVQKELLDISQDKFCNGIDMWIQVYNINLHCIINWISDKRVITIEAYQTYIDKNGITQTNTDYFCEIDLNKSTSGE